MQVKDVMTRAVQMIPPHGSLQEAAELMKALDVGSLLVGEGDRLAGIITDRDIAVRAVAEGQDCWEGKVRDAMSMDIACCGVDDDVEVARQLMQEHQIRRLPVLDHNGHLVGIVSLGDLAVHAGDACASGETLQAVSQPSHS
jgi:CBS domain-containing protein